MPVCATCGRESPDDFGFCPGCGAALTAVPAREVRKVVTVLFCDLTGSTAIGERTDPEALRALMNRYYDTARVVLERHGGTVEKFVGDAVMAVFGIPVASEDDALRATRAAVDLRDVVHELGLEARIGVNTGAVVAGEGDTLVTGDAVNVAARLEQAAGEGEILLGEDTLHLVRDAVHAEPVELELKGKARAVPAHLLRVLDASAAGVARRLERPMVGRERERDRLRADFGDVVESRTCRLFTLIGPAGIGKSRLVADFLDDLDGVAQVARGRALSYGEGITYWPLVEILIQLGIEPGDAIRSSSAETQLATRALFERRAEDGPLVLVVDDLHWAEPPMLDLVDHVADWARAAPILLVCVSRPELLDVRPQWAGGKLNATSILLEPLASEEVDELANALLHGLDLDPETRARILATAEGNPLFLEEMAALAREARGTVDVPPTIRALLQARLDTLDDEQRAVIERGAVEGQVFHRGAVTALATDWRALDVPGRLTALVRKELVRPERSIIAGDDAFRFRHLLIRDAAYEALPKAVRADLHERLAGWLEEHAAVLEQDEILGYHLEQAARYRAELDPHDARVAGLRARASHRLAVAGQAAFERDDLHATRNLLSRAAALLDEGPARRALLPTLIVAAVEVADKEAADALLDELRRGDAGDRAWGTALGILLAPNRTEDDARRELTRVDEAQRTLRGTGDISGVACCEEARFWLYWGLGYARDAHLAVLAALDGRREAGLVARQSTLISWVVLSAIHSGASADALRSLIDRVDDSAEAAGPLLAATLRSARARVDYAAGSIDLEALRERTRDEIEFLEQIGIGPSRSVSAYFLNMLAPWLEADSAGHALGRRRTLEAEEGLGTTLYLANIQAEWALSLCEGGDAPGALDAVARGRDVMEPGDVADQVLLDAAEGWARALQGSGETALRLLGRARAAVERIDLASTTDQVDYVDAAVRVALGDLAAARALLESLVERSEARGFHRYADRYRRDLRVLYGSS